MASAGYRFERFILDPEDRQLRRDDVPVEISSRYFDALALLVREPGKLIPKDRFFEEVWHGVPVTDEALTQCIKTLRRQLGDNAASPCFIETVPKHGYRFIAAVERVAAPAPEGPGATVVPVTPVPAEAPPPDGTGGTVPIAAGVPLPWQEAALTAGAGTLGAGVAGLLGGLAYGFAAASQPAQAGVGALSVLLVVTCIALAIALLGGAGVSLGIAAAGLVPGGGGRWAILGGAVGGMLVGAVVKLLGLDAFTLLFGQSPGDITGAAEGMLLGAAVGLGAWAAGREGVSRRRGIALAAACGGAAGLLSTLLGGRMLAGSLDLLAQVFPDSRLRLDSIGTLLGEPGLGPVSQAATGALEGALFAGCLVGAMVVRRGPVGRISGREPA